ncbi:MAG: AI-2E family transporter [Thermoleophilia bacterium]|nr:AI-2E family transporter [Thermoleophilia bacterium]
MAIASLSVPPWLQLIGVPLALFVLWSFASSVSHAIVVFLVAMLISLLLDPIVRIMTRLGVPRAIAVLIVFSLFSMLIVTVTVVAVDLLSNEAQRVQQHLPETTTTALKRVDTLQRALDRHHVPVDLRSQAQDFITQLEHRSSELSTRALQAGRSLVGTVAAAIFNVVLVVVVTIYMLLSAPRIAQTINSAFPHRIRMDELFSRLETALQHYIRGQLAASFVMGISATTGLWLIGVIGLWPAGKDLAVIFGIIVAITEFAPSIGPIIGATPAVAAALFDGIFPALVVLAFFVILHQIEGHIVIPKLMGAAIAVHPLLVIFGIIAGAQIFGFGGVILVLPLLAIAREIMMFAREHVTLGEWPRLPDSAIGGLAMSSTDPQPERDAT